MNRQQRRRATKSGLIRRAELGPRDAAVIIRPSEIASVAPKEGGFEVGSPLFTVAFLSWLMQPAQVGRRAELGKEFLESIRQRGAETGREDVEPEDAETPAAE